MNVLTQWELFEEWALRQGWFEYDSGNSYYDGTPCKRHHFVTPQGSIIRVEEINGKIIRVK